MKSYINCQYNTLVCIPSRISIHQYKLSILFYPCVFVCLENRIVEKDSIENGFLFFLCPPQLYIASLTTTSDVCMLLKSYCR